MTDRIAEKRARTQRQKAPLKNLLIWDYVEMHLAHAWTPEQIAGRLPIEFPGNTINDESIYRCIYRDNIKRGKLWKYLELRPKRRQKRHGRHVQQTPIPNRLSIEVRPEHINARTTFGHWETDNETTS